MHNEFLTHSNIAKICIRYWVNVKESDIVSTVSSSIYDTPSSKYIVEEWYKHMRRSTDNSTIWDCYLLLQDQQKRRLLWNGVLPWKIWDELTGLHISVCLRLLEVVEVFIHETNQQNDLHDSGNTLLNIGEHLNTI